MLCRTESIRPIGPSMQRVVTFQIKPTVSLDVISLVVSSCGHYRGQIEQPAAQ